jgi:hypothetical protein
MGNKLHRALSLFLAFLISISYLGAENVSAAGIYRNITGGFSNPYGISVDSSGNIYVVESIGNRVEKFDGTRNAANEWSGSNSVSGFDNPTKAAAFDGNIYVSDTNHWKIVKINASTGSCGDFLDFSYDYSCYPQGLAFDADGNIYVADNAYSQILKFDCSGNPDTTWNLNVSNSLSGAGLSFNAPEGIAVDSNTGFIYVADTSSNVIRRFNSLGSYIDSFGDDMLISPRGLAIDANSNIYVADTGNNRIVKYSGVTPAFSETWGALGSGDGEFNYPSDVAVDVGGNLYVADSENDRVVYIDPVSPKVTSIVRHSPTDSTTGAGTVTFRVTFSENVSGVDTSDFVLSGTGSGTIDSVSKVSDKVADVTVIPTGGGTLRLDLNASGTGIVDEVGHEVTGGFTLGEGYTIEAAPVLAAGAVTRSSDTTGTVKFSTTKAGEYYYAIVADGDTEPVINTTGAGTPCASGEVTITNPAGLTAGAKDVYIKVKDSSNNVSDSLKIDLAALPGAPTTVTATAGDGMADVSFTAPVSDGGSAITSYTVTSNPGGQTATGSGSPLTVTGLSNGTSYTFTVTATNGVGTGAASTSSAPVMPKGVPGAPTGVTATAGDGEAAVSFTAPASNGGNAITSYTVTASPGGKTATGTVSPLTVTGLTNGAAYTFTVTATNGVGTGAASAASTAVTPKGVPGAPAGVTATAGNKEAVVSFTAPSSNGSTITSYTVTSSPGGKTATGSGSPLTVTGLTNGTAYTFTVTATNGVGTGAASGASASVVPKGVPGAPTGVFATAGDEEAIVSFTAPASDEGSAITSYTVTSNPGGKTATGTVSPLTVTGLTNGTAYTFTVTATNGVGTGIASAASAAVTPKGVPGAPAGVTAAAGDEEASVSFTAPSANGSAIISYTVTASPGGKTATGSTSPITVTGLTNGTAYTFTVTAANIVGTGAPSAASSAVTPASVPGAPTGVTATSGNEEAVVSFTAPASSGGSAITSYTVTANPGGITASGAGSPITVTGLTNGTAYTFTVTATNGVGTGLASAASTAVTPATVPGVPTGITAAPGDGEATVSFTAPASNGGSAITIYTITASPGGKTATGSGSPITVTGLTNGTAYTFTVAATNGVGTGTASAASTAVTPASVPGAPTGVTATAGDGQATVSFTAPASNGGSAITSFTVTSNPGGITVSGSGSPLTVTGLINGVKYTFTVTATNLIGTGADSDASAEVKPTGAPGAPTGVTATAGDGQAEVSFTAPANDGGSAIISYTVTANPGGKTVTGNGSPLTVTGLTNGTAYTFTVTATNAAGTGTASAASLSITPAVVPNAPTGVTAVSGDGQATVSFIPPASNGGSAITSYTVTANPGGKTVTGSGSPLTVTGLANGTAYTFTVTATNGVGTGTASTASAAVTPATEPGAPTGVTATAGNGQATVNFIPPASNGGSAITSYTVIASPGGQTATGSGSPLTVTELANGTEYTFTVTAANGVGTGTASAASAAVKPAELQSVVATNGKLSIKFNVPATAPSAGDFTATVKINGGTANAIVLGNFTWDAGTRTVSYSYAAIDQTTTNQSVVVNVSYKGKDIDAPAFTINAKSTGGTNNPPPQTSQPLLVNGKDVLAATVRNSNEGDKTVTTITIDPAKFSGKLTDEAQGTVVKIPVSNEYDVVAGALNGQIVKDMENKDAVLEIDTPSATYTLPARQIDIEDVIKEMGENVKLEDVLVKVKIEKSSEEIREDSIKGGFKVVAKPIDFNIQCTYGGKTVEVKKFNAYVERVIAIPDGAAGRITTGVVVNADGTVNHIPTKIEIIGGKYYAKINSLTNSPYAVIWHPKEFADVRGHWSEKYVNEMGARLVISGIDETNFVPDRQITRGEFAVIAIKALGLKAESTGKYFKDVKATDWYSSAVSAAYEYKLLSGYADGSFKPDKAITREEAMSIIAKAMKIAGIGTELSQKDIEAQLEKFVDSGKISNWAKQSAAGCVKYGIISGNGGKVRPSDNISRAETATIFMKMLQEADLI